MHYYYGVPLQQSRIWGQRAKSGIFTPLYKDDLAYHDMHVGVLHFPEDSAYQPKT